MLPVGGAARSPCPLRSVGVISAESSDQHALASDVATQTPTHASATYLARLQTWNSLHRWCTRSESRCCVLVLCVKGLFCGYVAVSSLVVVGVCGWLWLIGCLPLPSGRAARTADGGGSCRRPLWAWSAVPVRASSLAACLFRSRSSEPSAVRPLRKQLAHGDGHLSRTTTRRDQRRPTRRKRVRK